MSGERVVAGVDGTDAALRAAGWAARQSVAWGLPLRLVHGLRWPLYEQVHLHQPVDVAGEEAMRQWARDVLDEVARRCRAAGAADVRAEVVPGDPADVLAREAEHAAFVVVGHADGGGVTRALLGSTSAQLVQACTRPVVIVRAEATAERGGPVVVGVDGSPVDGPAVRFAHEFADRVGAGVVVVHASDEGVHPAGVEADLADCARRHPGVRARLEVVTGAPVDALLAAARDARLVVVGSHGAGVVRRALFGSVGHSVVDRATCPVAVLPPHAAP
ncbi:universal stress protein [Saccharothrix syringae]|nr:universal stress protein [Saccharothrix syringae]